MTVERSGRKAEVTAKYENCVAKIGFVEAALTPPGYLAVRTNRYELVVDEQFLKGMYKVKKALKRELQALNARH